jgi:hypothetical protein
MNTNALSEFATADAMLDGVATAPARYATALVALVGEGWANRLPIGVKGRPTGDRKEAITEAQEAFAAAGVDGKDALTKRVQRLTYALAIYAANPRKDAEADDKFVTRVKAMRKVANAGDEEAVLAAIAGKAPKPKTPKAPKAPKTAPKPKDEPKVETPKPVTVTDTHNALMAALSAHMDALTAHKANGGTVTKAMVTAAQGKINALLAMIAA